MAKNLNSGTYTCVARDWIVFEDIMPPHVVGKNDHGRYHIAIVDSALTQWCDA